MPAPRVARTAFGLLDKRSRPISDTCTTEDQMLFWLDWFYRSHTDTPLGMPIALKTVDCPVLGSNGAQKLDDRGRPVRMRCVWEVARCAIGQPTPWVLITWEIASSPGIRFKHCTSLAEALFLFDQPPAAVCRP